MYKLLLTTGLFLSIFGKCMSQKDSLPLSIYQLSIKKGLELSDEQASAFFLLEHKRSLALRKLAHTKNKSIGISGKSTAMKDTNTYYLSQIKTLLNPRQLRRFQALEEARKNKFIRNEKRIDSLNRAEIRQKTLP